MYRSSRIGVVVPAFNEEKSISSVLRTMPGFVDRIYAVNDQSTDETLQHMRVAAASDARVVVVNRLHRGGVGAAILSGHRLAMEDGMAVTAVLAGDGQMDPSLLPEILNPVVDGRADYSKGDRLSVPENRRGMPRGRLFGNMILTLLTRIASGYHSLEDPQNGYTAISARVLQNLDLDSIDRGYAFENDMLVKLGAMGARVADIPQPALYNGEESKLGYPSFVASASITLLGGLLWRLWTNKLRMSNNAAKLHHSSRGTNEGRETSFAGRGNPLEAPKVKHREETVLD